MTDLTHTTAVAIVPSPKVWPPIQAERRRYDRKLRRWMPHVTLLYPFWPAARFDEAEPRLRAACATVEPFRLRCAEPRFFRHRESSHTLWLAPEPDDAVRALHAALLAAFPECDHTARLGRGFTPHLSLGQARGAAERDERLAAIRARLRPIRFPVNEVCVLARGERRPDDVFAVVRRVPLGAYADRRMDPR